MHVLCVDKSKILVLDIDVDLKKSDLAAAANLARVMHTLRNKMSN